MSREKKVEVGLMRSEGQPVEKAAGGSVERGKDVAALSRMQAFGPSGR